VQAQDQSLRVGVDFKLVVRLRSNELEVVRGRSPHESTSEPYFLPLPDFAKDHAVEALEEVAVAHPELPIFLVKYRVYCRFRLLCPEFRAVAPVAAPLEGAPRIPDVQQPVLSKLSGGDH